MKLGMMLVTCGLFLLPIGCGSAGDEDRGLDPNDPGAAEVAEGVTVDACFDRTIGDADSCQSSEELYEQATKLCRSQKMTLLGFDPDESCDSVGSHSAKITCCYPSPSVNTSGE